MHFNGYPEAYNHAQQMGPRNHVLEAGLEVPREAAMATIFGFRWAMTSVVSRVVAMATNFGIGTQHF